MIDEPRREIIPHTEELAGLDRQWAAIKNGEATIPHAEVLRWLQTWGTPAFGPWNYGGR
jgi:predicted transcriptional regulator